MSNHIHNYFEEECIAMCANICPFPYASQWMLDVRMLVLVVVIFDMRLLGHLTLSTWHSSSTAVGSWADRTESTLSDKMRVGLLGLLDREFFANRFSE